jgi:hypothetical protein
MFRKYSRPSPLTLTTSVSPVLIGRSVGLVLTDAKPPLFSSDNVPKNSKASSGPTRNRPSETPPITPSFTVCQFWAASGAAKLRRGRSVSWVATWPHKVHNIAAHIARMDISPMEFPDLPPWLDNASDDYHELPAGDIDLPYDE